MWRRWKLCWCFLRDDDDPILFKGQKYDCASTLVSSRGKLATIYEASVEAAN
jgi:hypothetical protein